MFVVMAECRKKAVILAESPREDYLEQRQSMLVETVFLFRVHLISSGWRWMRVVL